VVTLGCAITPTRPTGDPNWVRRLYAQPLIRAEVRRRGSDALAGTVDLLAHEREAHGFLGHLGDLLRGHVARLSERATALRRNVADSPHRKTARSLPTFRGVEPVKDLEEARATLSSSSRTSVGRALRDRQRELEAQQDSPAIG